MARFRSCFQSDRCVRSAGRVAAMIWAGRAPWVGGLGWVVIERRFKPTIRPLRGGSSGVGAGQLRLGTISPTLVPLTLVKIPTGVREPALLRA